MVTPTSLNGAGCAAAVPAASVDASIKAANALIVITASLLSLNLSLLTGEKRCELYQVAGMCVSGFPPAGTFEPEGGHGQF
jgi:hypothetical protein